MDRFGEMQTFVRVVEAGGITAAAHSLGVAKSAVSRRLADLESRLGAQLLVRTTRRMTLTDGGRAYYARCQRLLADLEEADQAVTAAQGEVAGTLRIAAPLSFGLGHLAPALDDFLRAHPRLAVDLDLNDRRVNLVEEGMDVAVRIGRLSDSSLIARRLAPVRQVVVASPAWWDSHGRPRRPADLSGHAVLTYANIADAEIWGFIGADDGSAGRPTVRARVNNGDLLAALAAAGHGVTVLPTFLAHTFIEDGRLEPVLLDTPLRPLDAWAVYPPTRHLSRRVRAFIDYLADRFGDPPYWDRCLDGRAG